MRNPAFNALLDEMKEIHERKNSDYAQDGSPYSNFEFAAQTAGVTVDQVFRVLIGVKLARLNVLTASGKEPNNESIQDTRKDLAVYAALQAAYEMPGPKLPDQCAHRGPNRFVCDLVPGHTCHHQAIRSDGFVLDEWL